MAIPDGPAGTKATLDLMSRIVRRYKRYVPLRELTLSIIRDLPGRKNFAGQVRRVRDYVRNNIQYVRDVSGVETVQTPERTLNNRAGDCDDQAVLVAAMLETIGHPTRFVAIRSKPFGPYTHVYAETRLGRGWASVETTEDWPVGFNPPNAFAPMRVHN